ncbi:MAG TPA: hypothetical protein VF177_21220 [Anaerolineae bacterium]
MTTDKFDQGAFLERVSTLALRLYSAQALSSGHSFAENLPDNIDEQAARQAAAQAESEMEKQSVKKVVCAALKSTGDDLGEIAKVVGAALLPLVVTGAITLPVTPLAFAFAALFVYRAGVSAYCARFPEEDRRK